MNKAMIYAKVWRPVSTILSKAGTGDIDLTRLFGTSGEDGLIIQTNWGDLRQSIDGTQVIMKTNSGQENRVEGIANPLDELTARAAEEGLNYTLYSAVPVILDEEGCYCELEDDTDWGSSDLTSIHTLMTHPDWDPGDV